MKRKGKGMREPEPATRGPLRGSAIGAREAHLKLEVFRAANGRPPLHPEDPRIVAVASDHLFPDAGRPVLHLDDVGGIADLVLARAEPLGTVLARLEPA